MAVAPPSDGLLDPSAALVNVSCFDLLLIELVPLAERMARSFEASLDQLPPVGGPLPTFLKGQSERQSLPTPAPTFRSSAALGTDFTSAKSGQTPAAAGDGGQETEVFRDSVYVWLERLGFRVGEGLSEQFSRDKPRFSDQLDVIKFLCKELWTVVFKKQIDNLKTNHRGVFVLTDSKFRPLSRMSMANNADAVARAQIHLYFPCGIINGVLSSLGIKATVQAETTELPTAVFQIKTNSAKP